MQRARTSFLPEGEEFNGYRILRVLGAGGFGVTYLAKQTRLDRDVALKEFFPSQQGLRALRNFGRPLVFPEPGCEAEFANWLKRFATEARTLVRFRHANIVQLHDFFEANGTGYHVMEFVAGRSLKEEIRDKGTLPDADLARLVAPLLDGLEAIHALNVVHRDVKPDNIFVRADGSPILLDFGAARRMRAGTEETTVTVMATPGFAPFEQYSEHGDLGPWTDIYALAATLYCAMTGRAPVDATKRMHAFAKGEADPLPPVYEAAQGKYHPVLLTAVQAGLATVESDRPQSIAEWRRALSPWLGRSGRGDPPSRPQPVVAAAPAVSSSPASPNPPAASARENATPMLGSGQPAPAVPAASIDSRKTSPTDFDRHDRPVGKSVTGRPGRWRWAAGIVLLLGAGLGVAAASGVFKPAGRDKDEIARATAESARQEAEKQRQREAEEAKRKEGETARKRAEEKAAADRKAEQDRQEAARREAEAAERKRQEEEAARKQAEEKAAADRKAEEAKREEETRKKAEAAVPPAGREFRDCPECPEMVTIPAGNFTMGSPASEEGRDDDEGPQRRVTVARPFALGKHEVTFAEWDACVAAQGCAHRPEDRWGRGRQPAINVSWDDAKAYVAWLSRKTGKTYRLPSEAEWEYAARAGTTTPFHTGMTISTDEANYNGNYTYGAGREGVYRARTLPVGSLARNAFGLYDMHGNVWEWVEDCWDGNYNGAPDDARARTTGACSSRVVRGGSWGDDPRYLRAALRYRDGTGYRGGDVGFRVARTF